jgi:hypothetical protein
MGKVVDQGHSPTAATTAETDFITPGQGHEQQHGLIERQAGVWEIALEHVKRFEQQLAPFNPGEGLFRIGRSLGGKHPHALANESPSGGLLSLPRPIQEIFRLARGLTARALDTFRSEVRVIERSNAIGSNAGPALDDRGSDPMADQAQGQRKGGLLMAVAII